MSLVVIDLMKLRWIQNVNDALNLSSQSAEEELLVQETARNFVDNSLKPRTNEQYRDE